MRRIPARRARGIRSRMVPAALYQRVWADQTVGAAAAALLSVQMHPMSDDDPDRGRRTLLVFDRDGGFVGLVRAVDIVRAMVSAARSGGASAAAIETGAAAVTGLPVRRIAVPVPAVDVETPVLEAADLICSQRLSYLAITRKGKLVGILRPEDLYQEAAAAAEVLDGPSGGS